MIKPWKDRVEEAAHFREEDYINDVQYFMQAEIDELRSENARLRGALADMVDAVTGVDQISAVNAARAALGEKS